MNIRYYYSTATSVWQLISLTVLYRTVLTVGTRANKELSVPLTNWQLTTARTPSLQLRITVKSYYNYYYYIYYYCGHFYKSTDNESFVLSCNYTVFGEIDPVGLEWASDISQYTSTWYFATKYVQCADKHCSPSLIRRLETRCPFCRSLSLSSFLLLLQ